MSKIVPAQSVLFNQEYRKLTSSLEKIEDSIYDVEVELAKLYRKKHEIKKKIQAVEEKVILSLGDLA